jgi:hypothetical protein
VKARGQLRHRFHGTYSAVIGLVFEFGLVFESAQDANEARQVLGDEWQPGKDRPDALLWVGDSDALERVSDALEAHGADRKKIASIAKSIDFGEPFEIDVQPKDKGKKCPMCMLNPELCPDHNS